MGEEHESNLLTNLALKGIFHSKQHDPKSMFKGEAFVIHATPLKCVSLFENPNLGPSYIESF